MVRALKNVLLACMLLSLVGVASQAQDGNNAASAILVDNTGSLRSQLDFEQEIAKELLKRIYQRGPVSLLHFKTGIEPSQGRAEVVVGTDWGRSESAIGSYIDGMITVGGQTALIDAIYFTAEKVVARVEQDKLAEGVVYVITDGEDRASAWNSDELLKYLAEKRIRVFAVGLVSQVTSERGFLTSSSARKKAMTFLSGLIKRTGGSVVFPKGNQTAVEIVDELLALSGKRRN